MCCLRARPCGIIQTGNFTGWGSERVNSELVPTRVVGHSVKALIDSDGAMVRQERLHAIKCSCRSSRATGSIHVAL